MNQQTNPQNNPKSKKALKLILFSSVAVFLTFIIFFSVSFAQKMNNQKNKFFDDGPLHFMIDKMAKDLDLNEQQKTEVEKIRTEIKDKIESRKKERENRFNEFEQLFMNDKISKDDLKQLHQKHETDREEMKDFFAGQLVKFHSVLTADQRKKVVERMKVMREKKEFFREHFKPHDRNKWDED